MAEPAKTPPLDAKAQSTRTGATGGSYIVAEYSGASDIAKHYVELGGKENEDIKAEEPSDESISEHIISNVDYSINSQDHSAPYSRRTPDLLQLVKSDESNSFKDSPLPSITIDDLRTSQNSSKEVNTENAERQIDKDTDRTHLTHPDDAVVNSNVEKDDQSQRLSHSWPIPITDLDDTHISSESPINLPMESSSHSNRNTTDSVKQGTSHASVKDDDKRVDENSNNETTAKDSIGSERFPDSLSETSNNCDNRKSPANSSSSEEIIKLDIRGQAAPKIPLITEKIIFGPPPEDGELFDDSLDNVPAVTKLLSQFILGASNESIHADKKMKELNHPEAAIAESFYDSLTENPKLEQSDRLVEELTIHVAKEKDNIEQASFQTQTKSLLPDAETCSFSTMTTDYKTICEEYHVKFEHLEEIVTRRDEIITRLNVSLQRSIQEKTHLEQQNQHLSTELQSLQHYVAELSSADHNTVKGQLSDFMKYENLLKDDSTKFYSAIMSDAPSESVSRSSNGEKDIDREEMTINYSKSDLKTSEESDVSNQEFEDKLSGVLSTLDEYMVDNIRNDFKERLAQLLFSEVNRIRADYEMEVKEIERQFVADKHSQGLEIRRLNELLTSVKAGSADLEQFRQQVNSKHEKEMENLRTYFEKKCSDMEKNYSEDVELSARAVSSASGGSASSLEAACEAALPYSSPLRAGGDYGRRAHATGPEARAKQSQRKHERQLEALRAEHVGYVNVLQARHREELAALEERLAQLRARAQTAENTQPAPAALYQEDIDAELEKVSGQASLQQVEERVRQEIIMQLQEQIQALLAEPAAELSSWPLDLVALRERLHGQACAEHRDELRAELGGGGEAEGGGGDKWRRRRNHSFDQNRQLEEVTKERDGLKRVACTLQRLFSQLVAYCAAAEDELNRTVLAELLAHAVGRADGSLVESAPCTPDMSPHERSALDSSLVRGKRVHFAPDLSVLLADMDGDALLSYLQNQDDLSLEIKNELDMSLQRLRTEAQELLDLSGRFVGRGSLASAAGARRELQMPDDDGAVELKRLGEALQRQHCDTCELQRKHMEDIQAESVEREGLLRSELQAAMLRLALVTDDDHPHADVIAEGYGTMLHARAPTSLPAAVRAPPATPPLDSRSASLDGSSGGRRARLVRELDALARERDDLLLQLEAANRQLRATRQFVEEQTTEREAERDEFARRLQELRDENARLAQRLAHNARILSEVEQLEAQTREMNTIIGELETRKSETDSELKATVEKISLLRDIIANLESQLEQKSSHESEILERLEEMRSTIDERDSKMRGLLGELESLKSERAEQSDASCVRCSRMPDDGDGYAKLLDRVKEQARWLEDDIHRRSQRLERLHEAVCSASCSEPSEDVSIRDQKKLSNEVTPTREGEDCAPRPERMAELAGVWECLETLARAEGAAVKRVRDLEMQRTQLKDVAQEVRAERDVLQQRMSEQALKISSLAARLEQQRTHAEALCHESTSQLTVRLHDALAEVQRLTDELDTKDKQLTRLRQSTDEGKRSPDQQHDNSASLYNTSCQPNDKIIILERELSEAHARVSQLEGLARALESDKVALLQRQREYQRQLAEREAQLQEILALKLDDENEKDHKNDVIEGAKNSARTLSDIVSISDYDEQDLQMRRVEHRQQNISGAPYPLENKSMNKTLPPELNERPQLSSLQINHTVDHLDLAFFSPNSLPIHLTSTANKDKNLLDSYKRNINETTVFGNRGSGDGGKQALADNCSMFPNREASDNKNVSIEPKKIDFSVEHSGHGNRGEGRHITLEELGINIDVNQQYYPDIFTQLKHEIMTLRSELERSRTNLKQAEEQLCEFPALKEEVEELKTMLEGTVGTMEQDKKFYETQLDNFTTSKNLLEQQLAEMSEKVNEKSKDLHLLKEDILRRENMVLELAKEKRNLVNKLTELELKYDALERKNEILINHERENIDLKQKLNDLKKMEQLVTEKNLQIDNLNEHLNRLDDLQRCLDDKTDEVEKLKEAIEEKSAEMEGMKDKNDAMSRDLETVSIENSHSVIEIQNLRDKLSKIDQEKVSTSFQLQTSISELEKMAACNIELSTKLEDMKVLNDKLKDKECEIEILKEDINYFHDEIASLKEELKMVSRSPSPRDSKSPEDKNKVTDRRVNADKKELVKIRKHVSLLQHELAFNKKDLNEKAFELARAKLDVTELKNNLNQAGKLASDREIALSGLAQENAALRQQLQRLSGEREQIGRRLRELDGRLREEADVAELAAKLQAKCEQCRELEEEMEVLKRTIERVRESPGRALAILPAGEEQALVRSGARSPTAELESAVRAQLSYSHQLDESIMEQILSGASRDDSDDEVPPLQLDISKSSSSLQSSTSERLTRLKSENARLTQHVTNLEARLADKEALITELNRIRDKLVEDWQTAKLQYEAEKDNSGRLQLLLDTQKETADNLQNQDVNMIATLKRRLERSMELELELQQTLQREQLRSGRLERQLGELSGRDERRDSAALRLQRDNQMEANERLQGEVALLRSKLERERTRLVDLQAVLDQSKLHFQREVEARSQQCTNLKEELAELKRLKHEAGVELVRAQEALQARGARMRELERRLGSDEHAPLRSALSEFEGHKAELSREISSLRRSLDVASCRSPQSPLPADLVLHLKEEKCALQDRVHALEMEIQSVRSRADTAGTAPEDKDQAVRFLHSRCLRLESCRKALVWQKRYLQRVLAGYADLERYLQRHAGAPDRPAAPRTFKSVATAVVGVVRMAFLVRRRQHARTLAADVLLRRSRDVDARHDTISRPAVYTSNSPPSRERATPRASPRPSPANLTQYYAPPPFAAASPAAAEPRAHLARRPDVAIFLEPSPLERLASEECRPPLPSPRGGGDSGEDASSEPSSVKEHPDPRAGLLRQLDSMRRRLRDLP